MSKCHLHIQKINMAVSVICMAPCLFISLLISLFSFRWAKSRPKFVSRDYCFVIFVVAVLSCYIICKVGVWTTPAILIILIYRAALHRQSLAQSSPSPERRALPEQTNQYVCLISTLSLQHCVHVVFNLTLHANTLLLIPLNFHPVSQISLNGPSRYLELSLFVTEL